jgi:GTPase SAR1 family protein
MATATSTTPAPPPAALQHEVGIVRHVARHTLGNVRLLLAGDAAVGKTSLLRALQRSGPYTHEYRQTSEPQVSHCSIPVPTPAEGAPPAAVTFICVDTPGGAVYHQRPGGSGLVAAVAGGARAIALCFDVASRDSLTSAGKCLQRLGLEARDGVPGVLLGCKGDLRGEGGGGGRAEVGVGEAASLAAQLGLKYFECSALTGEGVAAPFAWLAGEIAHGLL